MSIDTKGGLPTFAAIRTNGSKERRFQLVDATL
ncbi:MAG: hypothetical protein ACI9TZ_003374 [Yoonia sp.]|jgi:hypothetical protein